MPNGTMTFGQIGKAIKERSILNVTQTIDKLNNTLKKELKPMSELNLSKGQELNLSKQSTTALSKVSLGAGWDMASDGASVDIDLSAVALRHGKLSGNDCVCYFNQQSILGEAVQSMGDNLSGEGDGDDETVNVNLNALPADVTDVVCILNIYEASARGQHFGKVQNAFIRAYNTETGQELARTEVSATGTNYDNLVFAKLSRSGSEWVFKSIQEFGTGNLSQMMQKFK